jgi:hypothetical protein
MKTKAALVVLVSFSLIPALLAQAPRRPDLSGTWNPVRGAAESYANVNFPSSRDTQSLFLPAAKSKADASRPLNDLESGCVPRGAVRYMMSAMLPLDVVQTPQKLVFLFNQHSALRRDQSEALLGAHAERRRSGIRLRGRVAAVTTNF